MGGFVYKILYIKHIRHFVYKNHCEKNKKVTHPKSRECWNFY